MPSNPDSLSPNGRPDPSAFIATITLTSITLYNALELAIIIYTTFKRRSSLYFWSFVVATFGLIPHSLGFLLKALDSVSLSFAFPAVVLIGWICMVTGQSLVLYSRLYLVLHDEKRLRMVRNMIVFNAFVLHVPTVVIAYGKDYATAGMAGWALAMAVYEKVQLVGFFLQEVIISGIYIWETVKMLRVRRGMEDKGQGRELWVHLVMVNVVVLVLDVTILVLEAAGFPDVQRVYKGFAYSVKLKVEFSILNKLVALTTGRTEGRSLPSESDRGGWREGPRMYDGPQQDVGTQGRASGKRRSGLG